MTLCCQLFGLGPGLLPAHDVCQLLHDLLPDLWRGHGGDFVEDVFRDADLFLLSGNLRFFGERFDLLVCGRDRQLSDNNPSGYILTFKAL